MSTTNQPQGDTSRSNKRSRTIFIIGGVHLRNNWVYELWKRANEPTKSLYFVTGTKHGSHIYAATEGEARRIFHKEYNGESIIHLRQSGQIKPLQ